MIPVTPRQAASVILTRDGPDGVEILLVQRNPNSRFVPGAFAFPGGRLEHEDAAPELARLCRGFSPEEAARRPGPGPDPALAYWVAALREAFEEIGILLACDRAGAVPAGTHPAWSARLRGARGGLPAAFYAFLAR
jgi:8-oxo-dGTP pyrophosphatase MutT (NUDIX family)